MLVFGVKEINIALNICYGRSLFQFLEITRNQIQKLFSLNFVKIYQMVNK